VGLSEEHCFVFIFKYKPIIAYPFPSCWSRIYCGGHDLPSAQSLLNSSTSFILIGFLVQLCFVGKTNFVLSSKTIQKNSLTFFLSEDHIHQI
jgi:hypothetical protein